jgi:hypothetical protein
VEPKWITTKNLGSRINLGTNVLKARHLRHTYTLKTSPQSTSIDQLTEFLKYILKMGLI